MRVLARKDIGDTRISLLVDENGFTVRVDDGVTEESRQHRSEAEAKEDYWTHCEYAGLVHAGF